jgi:hypothetical protein
MSRRLGAYILPGDPTWLRSSLRRYYQLLDELVVLVPADGRGWTGHPIPVRACRDAVDAIDHRKIARIVIGSWRDRAHPMLAETAQRQAGIDAIGPDVDWILQIDNDELLPSVDALISVLAYAEAHKIPAVEWPMRVLFRRLGRDEFLEVCAARGVPRYDYPGPIAVRPAVRLMEARRPKGDYLRPLVRDDRASLQVLRTAAEGEARAELLSPEDAILHNSWGRSVRDVWRKTKSWGHANGLRGVWYFALVWLPAPVTWRVRRDLHPFSSGLWPRLRRTNLPIALLDPSDRDGI